jgi:hypothetical protein
VKTHFKTSIIDDDVLMLYIKNDHRIRQYYDYTCYLLGEMSQRFYKVGTNKDSNNLFQCLLLGAKNSEWKTVDDVRSKICDKLYYIIVILASTKPDENDITLYDLLSSGDKKIDYIYNINEINLNAHRQITEYIDNMKQTETRGSLIELLAASIILNKNINLYNMYGKKNSDFEKVKIFFVVLSRYDFSYIIKNYTTGQGKSHEYTKRLKEYFEKNNIHYKIDLSNDNAFINLYSCNNYFKMKVPVYFELLFLKDSRVDDLETYDSDADHPVDPVAADSDADDAKKKAEAAKKKGEADAKSQQFPKCTFPPELNEKFTQIGIRGDGNCLFWCLTHLPYWKGQDAQYVRREICDKLDYVIQILRTIDDRESQASILDFLLYENLIINSLDENVNSENIKNYIAKMRENRTYGSKLEILVAEIITRAKICLYHKEGTNDATDKVAYDNIKRKIELGSSYDLHLNYDSSSECALILHLCKYSEHSDKAEHYEILDPISTTLRPNAPKLDQEAPEYDSVVRAVDSKPSLSQAEIRKRVDAAWELFQKGGSKDFKYKYLKYKIKYLTLKNNTNF